MLRRLATIAGLTASALIFAAVPALASGWGNTDCTQNPYPGCELGVGTGGAPGHPGGGAGGGGTGGSGAASTGSSCRWVAVGGSGNGQQGRPGPPGQEGTWYVESCLQGGEWVVDPQSLTWVPVGAAAPGGPQQPAPPSPAQLAEIARRQLQFPGLAIATSPQGEQLVSLPTWLWLADGWRTVSATVSVPGVSVTATAAPSSVTWSMGDGASLTCSGPGSPFPAGGNPKAASPDCGYTYHKSSAGQPNEAFAVTVTVHWIVTWAGAGQGGTFPNMTTQTAAAVRVAESQGIATG